MKKRVSKMQLPVQKRMDKFRDFFLTMIKYRENSGVSQRNTSKKMGAIYHYCNHVERDIKENKIKGKTFLLACRYADALGLEIQFRAVPKKVVEETSDK